MSTLTSNKENYEKLGAPAVLRESLRNVFMIIMIIIISSSSSSSSSVIIVIIIIIIIMQYSSITMQN